MRIIPIVVVVFVCNICHAQQGRLFTFKEVGWTMTLPPDFELIDSVGNEKMKDRGKEAMEQSNDVTIDMSQTKTLISALKNKYNYFNSTITPYDVKKDGSYEEANRSVKDILYKTFADKMPDASIDSSSTTTIIDGISFEKFRIVLKVGDKLLFNMILLSKLYRNFDFGISYLYLDETTKQEMENILSTSKFRKE